MDEFVDVVCIRPVGLEQHHREPLLLDQPPRHARALTIELAGAVRGLAEQDELVVANDVQDTVVVALAAGQWLGQTANSLNLFG
jgi:hypothetical protein